VKERAVGFVEIPVARHTLELTPRLTARMPIGADVAASKPAVIGTIRLRTEVSVGIDGALAPSSEADERRWRAGCLRACIGPLLTGLAQRFVDEPGERLGRCGAFTPGLVRLEGRLEGGAGIVGSPDMDEEADQHESDHEELVKQKVRRHDEVLFHGDERRRLYRIHPLPNYPLDSYTRPVYRLQRNVKIIA